MKCRPSRWFVAGAVLAAASLAGAVEGAAAQGAGEEREPPRVYVTAWSGFSIREGQTTLRVADDMMSVGGRVTLQRTLAPQPWVQVDYFWRPELRCDASFACNDEGIALRGGVLLPLTEDETRPGLHPAFLAGVGVGFAEETAFSYLLGLGGAWLLHPRLAPTFEVRWERVPGLRNVVIVGAGLRIGVL